MQRGGQKPLFQGNSSGPAACSCRKGGVLSESSPLMVYGVLYSAAVTLIVADQDKVVGLMEPTCSCRKGGMLSENSPLMTCMVSSTQLKSRSRLLIKTKGWV